jgi:hypothetical protein
MKGRDYFGDLGLDARFKMDLREIHCKAVGRVELLPAIVQFQPLVEVVINI